MQSDSDSAYSAKSRFIEDLDGQPRNGNGIYVEESAPNEAQHSAVTSLRPTTSGHNPRSSPRPSYMNHVVNKTSSIDLPRVTTPASGRSASIVPEHAARGGILVVLSTVPHPDTLHFLGILLRQQRFSDIIITGLATRELEIKQMKMDLFALLGSLRQEVGVHVLLRPDGEANSLELAVTDAMTRTGGGGAVLCVPSYDEATSRSNDVLAVGPSALEQSWRNSVGFVHDVARQTLQKVTTFAVISPAMQTPTSVVNEAACSALLTELRRVRSNGNVTIGYADNILVADASWVDDDTVSSSEGDLQPVSHESGSGESPTKLWNMWSLQDQLDAKA